MIAVRFLLGTRSKDKGRKNEGVCQIMNISGKQAEPICSVCKQPRSECECEAR